MIILNKSEIQKLINMEEAIEVNESAYRAYSIGEAKVPLRNNMQLQNPDDFAMFMPGYVPNLEGLGIKVVTIIPENVKQNLPATQAVILLFDEKTGKPSALMDGTFLTALRTGAGSGIATKYLARKDARTVAVIGTGGMAPMQLEAMCCVRDIKKVYVWNRTVEKAQAFVNEMKERFDLEFVIKSTPQEALQDADIVVTSTASPTPVVKFEWLKEGAHVNAIGAFNADLQEVDEELIIRADALVVDGVSAASVAGDLAIPLGKNLISQESLTEIGTVIHDGVQRRKSDRGITYFKSVGLSVQDIAVATLVLKKAKVNGFGAEFEL